MISNFKQHFRGVTTSIVAPPVLLFAKVSARRAKYKAKVQKLSLFISEPPPDLRVSESARRAKYKENAQKLSLFISEPPPDLRMSESARRAKYKENAQKLSLFISEPLPNLRVSESARRAKCELKRRAKVQGESARRAIFFHHITMNFNHIYFICHHLCTVLNMGKCLECLFFVFLQ
ncbi:hypothetical protein [Prevotellamassilia timonensis]|uniref:hypothetical protein n=1 Tax=Prevotellamassilia timonensis TaxID=1852370 RepID=UPI00307F63EC